MYDYRKWPGLWNKQESSSRWKTSQIIYSCPGLSKIDFCLKFVFGPNWFSPSCHSRWIPVCTAALWTWKTQEINRQTGRSKFTRVQVETDLLCSGGHHNRKGWTDRRGGGSGQGRGRRLRRKLSMDNTEGNACLARTHTHTLTHVPYAHTYVHRQQMVGQAERL